MSTRVSTVIGWGLLAGLILLVIYVSVMHPAPVLTPAQRPEPTPVGERIIAACNKEFGPGTAAADNCVYRIVGRMIAEDHEQRLRRAERAAGL